MVFAPTKVATHNVHSTFNAVAYLIKNIATPLMHGRGAQDGRHT